LARHLGARVVTTASAANHDYVKARGAHEVIDYNAVDFTKVVKDVDVVFDTVGGDVWQRSLAVLRPGGRAAYVFGPTAPAPKRTDIEVRRPAVARARAPLERIVELVTSGAVREPQM